MFYEMRFMAELSMKSVETIGAILVSFRLTCVYFLPASTLGIGKFLVVLFRDCIFLDL